MEPHDPAEVSIVATSGRGPSLDELAALEQGWTEAAITQLMAAAAAADRWLAENPDAAARFFNDPAKVITEMHDAGVLTEPVDDLLAVLQSRSEVKGRKPGRVVRFAAESPLRSKGKYPPGEKGSR